MPDDDSAPSPPPGARVRGAMLGAICLGSAGAVLCAVLWFPFLGRLLRDGEFAMDDAIVRHARALPERGEMLFLGIDDASLTLDALGAGEIASGEALGLIRRGWPWDRRVWAEIVGRLCDAGARLVILDVAFVTPSADPAGDRAFGEVLARHRDRVVLASLFSRQDAGGGEMTTFLRPIPGLLGEAGRGPGWGFVNLWPDDDDLVRRARFAATLSEIDGAPPGAAEEAIPSIAAAALRKIGLGDRVPPGSAPLRFRPTAGGEGAYRARSVYEILVPSLWERNYLGGERVRDRIVIVGASAPHFHDRHRTPLGPVPGPALLLSVLGAAMDGAFIREPPAWVWMLSIVAGGLLAWLLAALIPRADLGLLALAGANVAAVALAWVAYDRGGWMIGIFCPLVALNLGGLGAFGYEFVVQHRQRARMRRTLDRYMSREVVREILSRPEDYYAALGGTRRVVSVMFCDLRGFTSMVERGEATLLVRQLNEYFGEMVEQIFAARGSVDKFIGDEILAVWGKLEGSGDGGDAAGAVRAGLRMGETLETLNGRFERRGWPRLAVGIGAHCGEALVGNFGSEQRMELTVMGDTVNLASRLQGLTRRYPVQFLISRELATRAGAAFLARTVDLVRVKGRQRPVEIVEPLGFADAAARGGPPGWLRLHEEGFALYRGGDFEGARARFAGVTELRPDDALARFHVERCDALLRDPPAAPWDGVTSIEQK